MTELRRSDLVDERACGASRRAPVLEPESTTMTSTGSPIRWRAIASRQRTRSAPPSFTGMTTEIIEASRREGTGTQRARAGRARPRERSARRRVCRPRERASYGRARRCVARLLHGLHECLPREEVDVRPVENPALRVPPSAAEQREPHRPVRHVGCRQDESALIAQERAEPRESRSGPSQVLDEVAAEDDVEGAALERERHRLDVSDEHGLAHSPRFDGRLGIELDADDGDALRGELAREVARGAADVQHAPGGVDDGELEHARVAAERPLVQLHVAGAHLRRSPSSSLFGRGGITVEMTSSSCGKRVVSSVRSSCRSR